MDVVISNAAKAPYDKIKNVGYEATNAAKRKADKLAYKCIEHGYKFCAISFETQGQWSDDTKCIFKSIISHMTSQVHARSQSATYWIRKFSIVLHTFFFHIMLQNLFLLSTLLCAMLITMIQPRDIHI